MREKWREEGEEETRGGGWTRATERRPHPWNPSCWLLKKKGPPDDCKTTKEEKVYTRSQNRRSRRSTMVFRRRPVSHTETTRRRPFPEEVAMMG